MKAGAVIWNCDTVDAFLRGIRGRAGEAEQIEGYLGAAEDLTAYERAQIEARREELKGKR